MGKLTIWDKLNQKYLERKLEVCSMKQLSFAGCCLYYYGRECVKTAEYTVTVLALLFIIHKLVSWALWVMSL